MRRGRRTRLALAVAAVLAAAASAPASAWAHAALLRTSPTASRTAASSPSRVALTFSEVIEPRFAVISVTDASGAQRAVGAPYRSATDATTIARDVGHLQEGWYLVYWRVISADGHPVRGAFTFAVGPNPGPPPQFRIPSLQETAATPTLVGVRWGVFLSVMIALGLFVFRCLIARPLAPLPAGRSLRAVTVALGVALAAGLLLVPLYAVLTTAEFSTLSPLDLGALAPLVRISSFGRALTDLWIVLALFALCAGIAVWLDRPARPQRSTVALAALGSALATGAALLVIPGLAGHPAQTSPAALALALDWVHLAAGSVWLGGLCGLMMLWFALPRGARGGALGAVVPRFSRVALVSVLAIIATGTAAALLHLPTLPSLWQTSYGLALLVKVVLLALAMLLGAYNMLVTTPRLETGARSRNAALGESGAVLLRRTVTLEIVLVAGALLAAAVLTSLPPPASALGKVGNALARVGPGPVTKTLRQGGYTMVVRVAPNRAALPNTFSLRLSRNGRPVTGATVIARFDMLDMDMSTLSYTMPETAPGLYQRSAPALVMVGHWGLTYEVTPRAGAPLTFVVVDKASG